ncbi:MAG TPA: GGDEF domain-containing protein [Burkholderiaceae bacterium]|nr:GGDEF domain-containing protein [Burkholderiaceae bacterium]
MRYTETKDRSADALRVALGHMGRHGAALNPITFTVWYEYAAGINPPLHEAIEQLLKSEAAIGDDTIAALYEAHIVPPDAAAVQRIGSALQRVMAGIASSVSQAGSDAGRFGAQLGGLSAALRAADVGALSPHLAQALAGTAEMQRSAEVLQQEVRASQSEIMQLRSDLDRARGEALLDPLTSILNRKGFDQRIVALLEEPAAKGLEHCLVMLDIDHFKHVNDTHGHVMGDRVIQGLGEILRQLAPEPAHATARYGGEEFAIVVPHSRLADALQLAERVRMRAKAMKVRARSSGEVLLSVTISGGVTALRPGDDALALIARADSALYQSKHAGRDRVSCI